MQQDQDNIFPDLTRSLKIIVTSIKMIFIFFPIPLPSYVMAALYMFYTIYGMRKQMDNIGHTAHFGGAITGLLATIAFLPSVIIESGFTLSILAVTLIFAAFIFKHKH